jgi:NTP pyrophosphatase (non-canonical NTP hydrolase)
MVETHQLQAHVAMWHEDRFAEAGPVEMALKACAEMGEFAEAIGSRTDSSPGPRGNVGEEAADVVICLFATIGRWWPEVDLMEEVRKKLAILTDPASGHRSASLA